MIHPMPSKKRTRGEISSSSSSDDALAPSKKPKLDEPPPKASTDLESAQQLASYALELMAGTNGTRLHCLGYVVKDDTITPWYFDASGMITTSDSLSLVRDFNKFAAFVVALASCTPAQYGALPETAIRSPPQDPASFPQQQLSGCFLTMHDIKTNNEVQVKLVKHIFTQYSLVGRRTFLYTANVDDTASPLEDVVVKFSYQALTRDPEQGFVKKARDAGVRHLPEIHMTADLWKMSDGVRQIFYETTKGLATFEDRSLRSIMYRRYRPVNRLFARKCELVPVMVAQMIDCMSFQSLVARAFADVWFVPTGIDDLRYKAGILHRDISVHNIMYEERDNKYHFVLIDFDMAANVVPTLQPGESTYVTSSKNRTGTLPFMARDFIQDAADARAHPEREWTPIPHYLRHDLESLYFVSIYCLASYVLDQLNKAEQDALREEMLAWERPGKLTDIYKNKDSCCLSGFTTRLSPSTSSLEGWLTAWCMFFQSCNGAKTLLRMKCASLKSEEEKNAARAKFDEETLDGRFTPDALREALESWMPLPVDVNVEL